MIHITAYPSLRHGASAGYRRDSRLSIDESVWHHMHGVAAPASLVNQLVVDRMRKQHDGRPASREMVSYVEDFAKLLNQKNALIGLGERHTYHSYEDIFHALSELAFVFVRLEDRSAAAAKEVEMRLLISTRFCVHGVFHLTYRQIFCVMASRSGFSTQRIARFWDLNPREVAALISTWTE